MKNPLSITMTRRPAMGGSRVPTLPDELLESVVMALELDGAVESILKSASVCRALCAVCQNHERWMRICTRRWWSSGLPEHVHDWRRFYIQRCSAEAGSKSRRQDVH